MVLQDPNTYREEVSSGLVRSTQSISLSPASFYLNVLSDVTGELILFEGWICDHVLGHKCIWSQRGSEYKVSQCKTVKE